uniref:Uncharacterized protein n=1 Tax=Arundo donax TaxID=35708 RepID=A0A0A9D5B1_ARUDO
MDITYMALQNLLQSQRGHVPGLGDCIHVIDFNSSHPIGHHIDFPPLDWCVTRSPKQLCSRVFPARLRTRGERIVSDSFPCAPLRPRPLPTSSMPVADRSSNAAVFFLHMRMTKLKHLTVDYAVLALLQPCRPPPELPHIEVGPAASFP